MIIKELQPLDHWRLSVIAEDRRAGHFDVSPYLNDEAFERLKDHNEFIKTFNAGYFVEWDCGADLSADTIEARWQIISKAA